MQFAVKCLLGLAVFAAPCAYDSDPREPSVFAALIAPAAAHAPVPKAASDLVPEPPVPVR